jgi:hypothetical protein
MGNIFGRFMAIGIITRYQSSRLYNHIPLTAKDRDHKEKEELQSRRYADHDVN